VYAGTIPARVGGAGVESSDRPYEQGDSSRRLNWRAHARPPIPLFSNEFQQERIADVAVVLDGGNARTSRFGESLFRALHRSGWESGGSLLQQGNRVGLLVYSHYLQWTWPGYGGRSGSGSCRPLPNPQREPFKSSRAFSISRHVCSHEVQIVLVSPLVEDDLPT